MNSLFKMLFLMANGQLITFGSVKLSILQYQIFGIVMVPAQPYSVIKVCNMISFSFSLWQSKHADISSSPALLFATNPKQRHAKSAAGISGWSCAVFGRQHRWQWRRSKSFCKAIPCSTFVCLFLIVPFNNNLCRLLSQSSFQGVQKVVCMFMACDRWISILFVCFHYDGWQLKCICQMSWQTSESVERTIER